MITIERLTDPIYAVGESPVWRAAEAALYWVDIPAKRICRLQVETNAIETWTADEMVACIAFDRDGALIAGMETGIFSLRLASGAVSAASSRTRLRRKEQMSHRGAGRNRTDE